MLISTRSTGVTLIFWAAGISYAVSGIIVYIEYGLSVPRRAINDDDITDLRKVMTDHDVTVLQRRLSGRKLAIPRRSVGGIPLSRTEGLIYHSAVAISTICPMFIVFWLMQRTRSCSFPACTGCALLSLEQWPAMR
jgi:hypothetical protein